jgi:hypothetical protein
LNCFSPSILYAGISEARLQQFGGGGSDVSTTIRYGPATIAQFDYDGAREIVNCYGDGSFDGSSSDRDAFRKSLASLIESIRPAWRRSVPFGRAAVFKLLDDDIFQSFQIASLTDALPDLECAQWWTKLEAKVRSDVADSQENQWRDAEYKTLMNERQKLTGTGLDPTWVSIDNNSAGYDIASWTITEGEIHPSHKFIEVKYSSSLSRFFISRYEWNFAQRHPSSWELQFWLGENSDPILLDVSWLEQHVAVNRGRGLWESMLIEVGV